MSSPFRSRLPNHSLAREHWFVVLHEGGWKVRHNKMHYGPYSAQAGALRAAVDEAHKAGRQGNGAQVFVEVKGGEFRLEWTYGLDPHPAQP